MTKKIFKTYLIPTLTIVISLVFGLVFKNDFLSILTLIVGFLNSYYMAIGKWYNYIYGLVFSITYGLICAFNGLYGWSVFAILFYIPSQVMGMINWRKNNENDVVKMRSFSFKISLIVCLSVIIGSTIFGYLLSLIPSQQLSFLDGTTQIVNVCGIVLSLLRFREAWYVWLINNVLDLSIWIINLINGTPNAEMMFITSLMYLVMNVIGVICWIKIERVQSKNQSNKLIDKEKLANYN